MTNMRALPLTKRPLSEHLLGAGCALFFVALVVVQIDSYDIWWHLAIGNKILATGQVPRVDHLTLLGEGRPYLDSHWLFQVAAASLARLGGVAMLPLLQATLYGAMVLLWIRRLATAESTATTHLLASLVVIAGIGAVSQRFLPRPEAVTYLGVTCLILLFEGYRRTGSRWLYTAPLVMVVWQNCHALYVVGYFIAGAYVAEALLTRRDRTASPPPAPLLVTAALCLAVYPLNPHGWRLLRYSLLLATEVGEEAHPLMRSLGELTPTFAANNVHTFAFASYTLLTTAAVAGVVASRRHPSLARLAILACFFALSLTGNRNIALFTAAATPLTVEMVAGAPWRLPGRAVATVSLLVAALLAVQTVRLATHRHYREAGTLKRFGLGVLHEVYPEAAVAFLRDLPATDGAAPVVLGHFDPFGGYYEATLAGRYRPLFDGRWEVYDQDQIIDLYTALASPPTYLDRLARLGLHLYAVDHRREFNLPLLRHLYADCRWALIFAGPRVALFAEAVPENRTLIENYPVDLRAAAATLPVSVAAVHRQTPQAWMNLMLHLGEEEAAMVVARRILAAVPEERQTAELLVPRLTHRGALEEALGIITRATGAGVASAPLASEEAYIHIQQGDLTAAAEAMGRAIALDPDNAELHANFAALHLATGDRTRAAQEIDTVARLAPDYPALAALRRRLNPPRR